MTQLFDPQHFLSKLFKPSPFLDVNYTGVLALLPPPLGFLHSIIPLHPGLHRILK